MGRCIIYRGDEKRTAFARNAKNTPPNSPHSLHWCCLGTAAEDLQYQAMTQAGDAQQLARQREEAMLRGLAPAPGSQPAAAGSASAPGATGAPAPAALPRRRLRLDQPWWMYDEGLEDLEEEEEERRGGPASWLAQQPWNESEGEGQERLLAGDEAGEEEYGEGEKRPYHRDTPPRGPEERWGRQPGAHAEQEGESGWALLALRRL